jgi:serine/threonine-protein kinase
VLNLIRDVDALAIKDHPGATLLTVFRNVCDAMMLAHSSGILHRHLKPENIMEGENGEVLVMDWGLQKCWRKKRTPVPRIHESTTPAIMVGPWRVR